MATKLKRVLVVCCLFVLYALLSAELSSDLDTAGILAGAVAATVVTAYLYTRIAKKVGLE